MNSYYLSFSFSISAFGILPDLRSECGSTCGKAQLIMNLKDITHYWYNPTIPAPRATINWSGTYNVRVKNVTTGIDLYSASRAITGSQPVFVYPLYGQTTFPISTIFSAIPYPTYWNVDDDQYDIYIYASYTLSGAGYGSSSHTIGSLTIPISSDLSGQTYPMQVESQHVQHSLMPTSVEIDGFSAGPNVSTPIYTCRNEWPITLKFAEVTECREYYIAISYIDVTNHVDQCEADVENWTGGTRYIVYNEFVNGKYQRFFDLDNIEDYLSTPIFSDPLNVGKTYRLRIDFGTTTGLPCPDQTIYKCVVVTDAPITAEVILNQANLAGTTEVVHSIGAAPLVGLLTSYFDLDFPTGSAITNYKVSLFSVNSSGGGIIRLLGDYQEPLSSPCNVGPYISSNPTPTALPTPLSPYIVDVPNSFDPAAVPIFLLDVPANASFGGYPGFDISDDDTYILNYGNKIGKNHFAIVVEIGNDCGYSCPQWSYFYVDGTVALIGSGDELPESTSLPQSPKNLINSEADIKNVLNKGLFDTKDVKIYPNPANNIITFSGLDNCKDLFIFTSEGKLIEKIKPLSSTYKLSLENYINAPYYYKLQNEDGTVSSGKFVKMQ